MIKASLLKIEDMCNGTLLIEDSKDLEIEGVSIDTRTIKEGQLFVPIVGENYDGHNFLQEAVDNGAVASLWNKKMPLPEIDNFPIILVDDTLKAIQNLSKNYRKSLDVKVIAITGSNGKTSTKDIIAAILKTNFKTQKTLGNYNNHLGLPLTLLSLDEDTEMAVLEMGTSNFKEISLLTSLAKPDIAIITNIGEAHLEDLKTLEYVAKAKLEILEELNPNGLFIYYGDDPTLKKTVPKLNIKHEIVRYGLDDEYEYIVVPVSVLENKVMFKLKKYGDRIFSLPMLGRHQIFNATCAIIVAEYFNIGLADIDRGFENIDNTGMRNELVEGKGFYILNDSYKSNPASVYAALETLYDFDSFSQIILVLGDMLGLGEEESKLHIEVGEKIDTDKIDYVITIGDVAKDIANGALSNFPPERVKSFSNKIQVIDELKNIMIKDSIVLVKASRSMELEDIVDILLEELDLK